jgi:hypothetical protein
MVIAAECGQQDILENIRQGNFYAIQGPEFKTITLVFPKNKFSPQKFVQATD